MIAKILFYEFIIKILRYNTYNLKYLLQLNFFYLISYIILIIFFFIKIYKKNKYKKSIKKKLVI